MSRDEIAAIRSYFSRSVDRYVERRRTMIRASMLLRETLGNMASPSSTSSSLARVIVVEGGESGPMTLSSMSPSIRRGGRTRIDTEDGSTNSLLLDETDEGGEGDESPASAIDGEEDDVAVARRRGGEWVDGDSGRDGAGVGGTTDGGRATSSTTAFEGEEILNDRPRMEDEWMSTQVRKRSMVYVPTFSL
jgi:hypothetical protein